MQLKNNRNFSEGGYFFLIISITRAMIATINEPKRNKSEYVTMRITPFCKRVLTAYRTWGPCKTMFCGEFPMVCLIPTIIISYYEHNVKGKCRNSLKIKGFLSFLWGDICFIRNRRDYGFFYLFLHYCSQKHLTLLVQYSIIMCMNYLCLFLSIGRC